MADAHILIVEDSTVLARYIEKGLEQFGYLVFSAASGQEAIQIATVTRPDLVLMDIMLPGGMDGIEAGRIIGGLGIPIVYVTAQDSEEIMQRAKITGPFGYILKPFKIQEVHNAIQVAIYKHKVERQIEQLNQDLEYRVAERTQQLDTVNRQLQNEIAAHRRAEADLHQSREELRALAGYLQSAREKERTRIAREIHDELGHVLTALKMDLARLSRRLEKEEELFQKSISMMELIDNAMQIVQHITSELRPGLLDHLGLAAAMEWQAREFQKRTAIECELSLDENQAPPSPDLATDLFRIFQETLTNAARHSRGTRINASLKATNGEYVLTVRDNGRGIAEDQIASPHSLGLIGIRERVLAWNGDIQIVGVPKQGTTVIVRVPMPTAKLTGDI